MNRQPHMISFAKSGTASQFDQQGSQPLLGRIQSQHLGRLLSFLQSGAKILNYLQRGIRIPAKQLIIGALGEA